MVNNHWLVVTGTMEFHDFPIIFGMECHHPNWRRLHHIVQRGGGRSTTKQLLVVSQTWRLANHRLRSFSPSELILETVSTTGKLIFIEGYPRVKTSNRSLDGSSVDGVNPAPPMVYWMIIPLHYTLHWVTIWLFNSSPWKDPPFYS